MDFPLLLAMFHRQIEGDYHLLKLMQRRYSEIGLGAEFYPSTTENLRETLGFRPRSQPKYIIHLPRHYCVLNPQDVFEIMQFVKSDFTDAYGLVIHDQEEIATRLDEYIIAVKHINELLSCENYSPILFIEYAEGIELQHYIDFFAHILDCRMVSACIDIGHIGMKVVQEKYAQIRPKEDIFRLNFKHPDIKDRISDVNQALSETLPVVIDVVKSLAEFQKPLHFHLHDAHPLSDISPYGVHDHLSFLHEFIIHSPDGEKNNLPLLFGPFGLARIVQTAFELMQTKLLSFSLEIHPDYSRLELGAYKDLFSHWVDKTRAEQVNAWIDTIAHNYRLLNEIVLEFGVQTNWDS